MNLAPYSYKSVLLNSGSYSTVLSSNFNTEISVVAVSRADETPSYGGKVIGSSHLYMTVALEDGEDLNRQMGILTMLFNPFEKVMQKLVVIDLDDGSRQWYVYATPSKYPTFDGTQATIEFFVADPIWRVMTDSRTTWVVSASGEIESITPFGNQKAYPKIIITPKSTASGGYAYKRFICIWNNSKNVVTNYSLDITGQTGKQLASSTLVAAGKMQSDLDDVRLVVDGNEVMYWITGANSATTGIHTAEIKLAPKIEMTLSGAIGIGDVVSSITCKKSALNLAALKLLAVAPSKFFAIQTSGNLQVFTFTSVDAANYKINGVSGAQKGTTACAHNDGDTLHWLEHDIWMMYGNASAGAMEVDNTRKPLQDLNASTNAAPVWNTFSDDDAARPGAWAYGLLATLNKNLDMENKSGVYTDTQFADSNPSVRMGMDALCFMVGSIWKSETATIGWSFFDPCGVTSVTIGTGAKYKHSTTFPKICQLQKSNDGKKFASVGNEAAPSVAQTWSPLTVLTGTKTLAGTYNYIRFLLSGSVKASADNKAAVEFGTITLNRDSTKVPTIIMLPVANNYYINETITNMTNGEVIKLSVPCALNESITIDISTRRVTYSDGTEMLSALQHTSAWLSLEGGIENILKIEDPGIANVEHVIEWTDRSIQ